MVKDMSKRAKKGFTLLMLGALFVVSGEAVAHAQGTADLVSALSRSASSDFCLDVAGGIASNRNNVQIFDCNGTAAQSWTFTTAGELRTGLNSNMCLDVAGGIASNRNNVQIFDCNGTAAQRWIQTTAGELRTGLNSNMCLDVAGGIASNRNNVQIFDCNGTAAQDWLPLLQ